MMRKSSTSSSGTQTPPPIDDGDDAQQQQHDDRLSKPATSRLAKTLAWRSSGGKTTSKKPPAEPKHPCERDLTELELHHHEALSTFTLTFGRRKNSTASFGSISPCNSRRPSVDAAYGPHAPAHDYSLGRHRHPQERMGSPQNEPRRERRAGV